MMPLGLIWSYSMEILNKHKFEDEIIVRWKFDEGVKLSDDDEVYFEPTEALAILLLEEVVFLNDHWWEKEWPEAAQKTISINVNVNDVFAWACGDAEGLDYSELESLYDHWVKDRTWGPAVWCCKKRNMMPQKPVAKAIKVAGIWDLESMGLEPNE